MEWPDGFVWGTAASSSQCEGAAPASDWIEWERAGRAPSSGEGNGFAMRFAGDFALYDCESILRYVDEAYDGPALQPADAKTRALMVEIHGIVRDYLHPAAIGKIATQRLFAPASCLAQSGTCTNPVPPLMRTLA